MDDMSESVERGTKMRISVQARVDLRDGPGTTGDGLVAASALPDANGLTLYGVLAAEGADIASVLCNFHLLDLFAERRAVSVHNVLDDSFGMESYRCADVRWNRACDSSGERGILSYLVPYLPVTPTFLVRFVMLAVFDEVVWD